MEWWLGIRLQKNGSGPFQAKEANEIQNESSICKSALIQHPLGRLVW